MYITASYFIVYAYQLDTSIFYQLASARITLRARRRQTMSDQDILPLNADETPAAPVPEGERSKRIGALDANSAGQAAGGRSPQNSPSSASHNYWVAKYQQVQKYAQEDNFSPAWRQHETHIFILSWTARPIFSRYGDDQKLSTFFGVLFALIENFKTRRVQTSPDDKPEPDTLHAFFAGNCKFVFLLRGPIYMVAISRSTASVQQLQQQLAYAHEQILSVLGGGIHQVLKVNLNADLRNSLGGTSMLLYDIVNESETNLGLTFDSYEPFRLNAAVRSKVYSLLKKSMGASKQMLYAIMLAGKRVIALVKNKDRSLQVTDLHVLINFITNSQSFRSSDAWSPICLPKFHENAFAHAYVSYVAEDVCVALLSLDRNDFYALHEAAEAIKTGLSSRTKSGSRTTRASSTSSEQDAQDEVYKPTPGDGTLLGDILDAARQQCWTVEDIDVPYIELRHFCYHAPQHQQFIISSPVEPYVDLSRSDKGQQEFVRAYQMLADKAGTGPKGMPFNAAAYCGNANNSTALTPSGHMVYWRSTTDATFLVCSRPNEFELFLTLLPITSKETALAAVHKILCWVNVEYANLFAIPQ